MTHWVAVRSVKPGTVQVDTDTEILTYHHRDGRWYQDYARSIAGLRKGHGVVGTISTIRALDAANKEGSEQ